jgi:hypothetical protein
VFGFLANPQNAQITIPIIVGNTSDTLIAGACVQGGDTFNCSLRGAIEQANAGSSNSIIRFGIPSYDPFCSAGVCTINLTRALPAITQPASIVGPGADKLIVKPATGVNARIFHVATAGTVSISDITISDGKARNGDPAGGNGAGILKIGTGVLNLTNTVLNNNVADFDSGGIYGGGGTVNVTNSTLTNNRAGANGGTGAGGGGIAASTNTILNVVNSTISFNLTNGDGAGIFIGGTANITNTTIVGNVASGAFSGDTNNGGGIFNLGGGTVSVKSTIIAVNAATTSGPDVKGNFISAGFNLIGKRDGGAGFTTATDQTGTIASPLNPMLESTSPQNNGGPTRTMALALGSPAIDKGASNGLTGNLLTDQRGYFRRTFDSVAIPNATGGNGTDIGAFELQSRSPADFDGDNRTDISIFRPSVGEWWINRSATSTTFAAQFGQSTDKIAPADLTGDGKVDIVVWRPSNGSWFVLRSENFSFFSFPFGTNGDVPAPFDLEGDGVKDEAVFRPSTATWFIIHSFDGGSVTIQQFGASGDVPVPGDYDGDGAGDIAIYRPSVGQWWLNRSTAGVIAISFGNSADKPVPGDYTGDGKTDVAFWRPSTGEWYVLRSEDMSFYSVPFGTTGDIPAPGDYDGDGKFDSTVFRPSSSTWFVQRSTAGTQIVQFGANGDRPIPNAFVP